MTKLSHIKSLLASSGGPIKFDCHGNELEIVSVEWPKVKDFYLYFKRESCDPEFNPADFELLTALRNNVEEMLKIMGAQNMSLKLILQTHEITCKGEECGIGGIDIGKHALELFEKWNANV